MPDVSQIYYLAGLLLGTSIRAWYGRKHKQDKRAIFREEGLVVGLLASLWGVAILLPLIHVFTKWLDFADYHLPPWPGWAGMVVFAVAQGLLWRSHADLGSNWRVAAQLREDHTLVTSGVFRYVRHPMYSAHWLWGVGQALLIQNWIAGFAGLVIFLPLYLLRVRREERMMLARFGEEYRSYINRTGRLIPRFRW